ncbi:hypothetical protein, partial [Arthrobacter sp. DR-2P]
CLPDPNTTGTTSIRTSSTRPRASTWPPTPPAATSTIRLPAKLLRCGHACLTPSMTI